MMSQMPAISVLLIDGENIPARHAGEIMTMAGSAPPAEARVYGDFSTPALQAWQECAAQYGLRLYQTAGKAGGKNSADMLLTIDAMDLMWVADYACFCIVSGDHDFAPLAVRLRRAGKTVVGIGAELSHKGFRAACDRFHLLRQEKSAVQVIQPPPLAPTPAKRDILILFETVRAEIAFDAHGWVHGGGLGSAIRKKFPDCKWTEYGAPSMIKAFAADARFETKDGGFIRLKSDGQTKSALRVVSS